ASSFVVSGSGPFGPIFFVVWQSLQPPIVTRYLPRSTGVDCAAGRAHAVISVHATTIVSRRIAGMAALPRLRRRMREPRIHDHVRTADRRAPSGLRSTRATPPVLRRVHGA